MADLDELVALAHRLADRSGPEPSARNLSALMMERARDRGHAPFLTFYDDRTGERTELSYATFDNWVSKTANMLVEELDLGRGDRVVTLLGNHWSTAVITFACWKVGCAVTPADADEPVVAARGLLETAGASTVFLREDLLTDLDGLRHETTLRQVVAVGTGIGGRLTTDVALPSDVLAYAEEVLAFADDYDDPDVELGDDALLVPPTRAGGAPAGVRLTQGNVLAAAEALGEWGLGPDDRLLCAQPVQLTEGLALAHLGPFAAGASLVLTAAFEPAALWRRVADERVSLAVLSPSNLDRLVDGETSSLPDAFRGVLVPAGAAWDVTAGASRRLGRPVWSGHGLVEATCASTLTPAAMDAETRSWLDAAEGRPVGAETSRASVTALDDGGQRLPHGAPGRLAVRGPVVMAGYDGHPDLNEEVFAPGWLLTSEHGVTDVDPAGRVHAFVTGSSGQLVR